ncbi:unnamed protein product [Rotaria socialis]|uniref:Uncharacterized protein n=2 Tax=Rotaria socialis TaxID=392032 RepID=A0A820NJI3_9BILA|nr:unnamed protein product [Rotaria socialis]CAF3363056.1 unnamed protein product [Rotaria socialis]CAF3404364.1 unnamed protein product [Rotaria socialis]CAF3509339.1 unnamed protein product [Rotaria socialis]CAF4155665.1 unnamed protein product [Rotaria socialis]
MDIQHMYSNRTVVSSRAIYDLVQIRRAAAKFGSLLNRTRRNITTSSFHQVAMNTIKINNNNNNKINTHQYTISDFQKTYNQFLSESLKAIIAIGTFSLVLMIIIVTLCIFLKYRQKKTSIFTLTNEQNSSLPRTHNPFRYNYSKCDTKNFSRKTRT